MDYHKVLAKEEIKNMWTKLVVKGKKISSSWWWWDQNSYIVQLQLEAISSYDVQDSLQNKTQPVTLCSISLAVFKQKCATYDKFWLLVRTKEKAYMALRTFISGDNVQGSRFSTNSYK